jgi:hypothetical protein
VKKLLIVLAVLFFACNAFAEPEAFQLSSEGRAVTHARWHSTIITPEDIDVQYDEGYIVNGEFVSIGVNKIRLVDVPELPGTPAVEGKEAKLDEEGNVLEPEVKPVAGVETIPAKPEYSDFKKSLDDSKDVIGTIETFLKDRLQ